MGMLYDEVVGWVFGGVGCLGEWGKGDVNRPYKCCEDRR